VLVAVAVLVLVGAVAVVVGDRRGGGSPAGSGATGEPVREGVAVATRARSLVVEHSDAEIERSLATLRRVDDHPLYEMTYYGPKPRLDTRPTDNALPAASTRKSFACTVFAAAGDPARPLFGRNFDWDPNPALVLRAEPRDGYRSVSVVDISYFGFDRARVGDLDDPARRSAVMRAVAGPFDGMNEHGLVVGMASVDAVAEIRPDRPAVGSVSIMRLVLDQARTVDEAVRVLGSYNIDFSGGPGLHYMVADATGASAVVEFVDGRMRVTPRPAAEPWQVMENFHLDGTDEPTRAGHQRYRTATERLSAAAGAPGTPAALDLLRDVAQNHTQWSAVYDLAARTLSLYTDKHRTRLHHFTL
jgi:hypothetical protein